MAQHTLSIHKELRVYRNCVYDDFHVNKKTLSKTLKIIDPITPFGWLGTELESKEKIEDRFARMLLGLLPSGVPQVFRAASVLNISIVNLCS